jgi:hypothetical protein
MLDHSSSETTRSSESPTSPRKSRTKRAARRMCRSSGSYPHLSIWWWTWSPGSATRCLSRSALSLSFSGENTQVWTNHIHAERSNTEMNPKKCDRYPRPQMRKRMTRHIPLWETGKMTTGKRSHSPDRRSTKKWKSWKRLKKSVVLYSERIMTLSLSGVIPAHRQHHRCVGGFGKRYHSLETSLREHY